MSPLIVALKALSLSLWYFGLFLKVFKARSIACLSSPELWHSNVNPEPYSVSQLYSCTESLSPPVLNAMTGVPPTKNSCYTIPPGSNADGMRPKSAPLFTNEPSVKNSSGAAQKQLGNLFLRSHIRCAHPPAYPSPC